MDNGHQLRCPHMRTMDDGHRLRCPHMSTIRIGAFYFLLKQWFYFLPLTRSHHHAAYLVTVPIPSCSYKQPQAKVSE